MPQTEVREDTQRRILLQIPAEEYGFTIIVRAVMAGKIVEATSAELEAAKRILTEVVRESRNNSDPDMCLSAPYWRQNIVTLAPRPVDYKEVARQLLASRLRGAGFIVE